MEIILNRWRGTRVIFTSFPYIKGVHFYALYLGLLVGFLSEYLYGLITIALFLIVESFAWGKWVGYLVSENGEKEYSNTNGQKFPYIHQVANFFFKEKENYLIYCRFALTLRGFVWGTPILTLLYCIDLISWYMLIINSIVLSFGFPIACELSKCMKYSYKSKYLTFETNWEKQEIIYGIIQLICITFTILIYKVYNGI